MQKPPFGPEYPRPHRQLSAESLRMTETALAGHARQFALPRPDECVFIGHSVQELPFAPEYPTTQRQLYKAGLPGSETELAGQAVHAALPLMFLYVLAAHAMHEAPVYPTLHRHAVDTSLAVARVVEDPGHDVQSKLPVLDLNFPTPHAEQAPPSAPVNPAVHLQLVATVLPAGELEDAGQLVQTEAPAREYVPAAQLPQTEAAAIE